MIRLASPSLDLEHRIEPDLVELASLRPGEVGIVASVEAAPAIGRRLLDLGFIPKTRIRVLRRAPLGDPVSYELRGYQICLRRRDAARVLVRRVESDRSARQTGRR